MRRDDGSGVSLSIVEMQGENLVVTQGWNMVLAHGVNMVVHV